MGIFKKKTENRSGNITENTESGLLQALIGSSQMDKSKAMAIPTVRACVNVIANTISTLPIKLYKRENDGKIVEVLNDNRTKLLYDDTCDALTSAQFWRAITEDYLLGKGGYAYINKVKGKVASLHYVDETNVQILKNIDPIFKDYEINVVGKSYQPFEFMKFLRHTKDGASGSSVVSENALALAVAYYSLKFEYALVIKGGNKKGFLKSEKKLTDAAMQSLKENWQNLYSNNSENMMVLNDGLNFQETSSTSVEMQLNENKLTNSGELSMLFGVPNSIIRGNANDQDTKNFLKYCLIPVLNDYECTLDRDLLLEKEKGFYFFAFDTRELTRGSIKERYEAYKTGIEANFLQIDEVRQAEDMEELGLDFIRLGLADVLYNPKTKEVYTPNTGQTATINVKGGE